MPPPNKSALDELLDQERARNARLDAEGKALNELAPEIAQLAPLPGRVRIPKGQDYRPLAKTLNKETGEYEGDADPNAPRGGPEVPMPPKAAAPEVKPAAKASAAAQKPEPEQPSAGPGVDDFADDPFAYRPGDLEAVAPLQYDSEKMKTFMENLNDGGPQFHQGHTPLITVGPGDGLLPNIQFPLVNDMLEQSWTGGREVDIQAARIDAGTAFTGRQPGYSATGADILKVADKYGLSERYFETMADDAKSPEDLEAIGKAYATREQRAQQIAVSTPGVGGWLGNTAVAMLDPAFIVTAGGLGGVVRVGAAPTRFGNALRAAAANVLTMAPVEGYKAATDPAYSGQQALNNVLFSVMLGGAIGSLSRGVRPEAVNTLDKAITAEFEWKQKVGSGSAAQRTNVLREIDAKVRDLPETAPEQAGFGRFGTPTFRLASSTSEAVRWLGSKFSWDPHSNLPQGTTAGEAQRRIFEAGTTYNRQLRQAATLYWREQGGAKTSLRNPFAQANSAQLEEFFDKVAKVHAGVSQSDNVHINAGVKAMQAGYADALHYLKNSAYNGPGTEHLEGVPNIEFADVEHDPSYVMRRFSAPGWRRVANTLGGKGPVAAKLAEIIHRSNLDWLMKRAARIETDRFNEKAPTVQAEAQAAPVAPTPQAAAVADPNGFVAMGKGMADGIADSFYDGWWDSLTGGPKKSSAFKNERRFAETKAAVDAGTIKTREELKAFLNTEAAPSVMADEQTSSLSAKRKYPPGHPTHEPDSIANQVRSTPPEVAHPPAPSGTYTPEELFGGKAPKTGSKEADSFYSAMLKGDEGVAKFLDELLDKEIVTKAEREEIVDRIFQAEGIEDAVPTGPKGVRKALTAIFEDARKDAYAGRLAEQLREAPVAAVGSPSELSASPAYNKLRQAWESDDGFLAALDSVTADKSLRASDIKALAESLLGDFPIPAKSTRSELLEIIRRERIIRVRNAKMRAFQSGEAYETTAPPALRLAQAIPEGRRASIKQAHENFKAKQAAKARGETAEAPKPPSEVPTGPTPEAITARAYQLARVIAQKYTDTVSELLSKADTVDLGHAPIDAEYRKAAMEVVRNELNKGEHFTDDVEEAAEMLMDLVAPIKRTTKESARAKHRLKMDLNDATDSDVLPMFDWNAEALYTTYRRQTSGYAGLLKAGFQSSSEVRSQIDKVRLDAALMPEEAQLRAKREADLLDHMLDATLGRPPKNIVEGSQEWIYWTTQLRRMNFANLMGNTGFLSLSEVGGAMVQVGPMRLIRSIPAYLKYMKQVRKGDPEAAESIFHISDALMGHGSSQVRSRALGFANRMDDDYVPLDRESAGTRAAINTFTRKSANLTARMSGMAPLTEWLRSTIAGVEAQDWTRAARKDVVPYNAKRMQALGVGPEMWERIKGQLGKMDDVTSPDTGRELPFVDFNKWDDGEAANVFMNALDRNVRRLILEGDHGHTSFNLKRPSVALLFQFLNYPMNAWTKQAGFALSVHDTRAAAETIAMSLGGAMGFSARTLAAAYLVKTSADERDKLIKQATDPTEVAKAAFYYSAHASLLPNLTDLPLSLAGQSGIRNLWDNPTTPEDERTQPIQPLFSKTRASGLAGDPLTGNATRTRFYSMLRSAGGLVTAKKQGGPVLTQQDVADFSKSWMPLGNHIITQAVVNHIADFLPDEEDASK